MKKKNLVASCLLFGCVLAGCSCNNQKVDTHANVSNENGIISKNRDTKFTIGDAYSNILSNQKDAVSKSVMLEVLKKQVNLNDNDMMALYKKYLNEYFEKTFVESSSYKYNGEFSEELVVKYLNSESYTIKCGNGVNSGNLDNSKFTCDYSDYIEKEVDYDIFLKMLKVKYIIDEKASLIDKNKARRVTYYTISKGSDDNSVREKLEKYVASIKLNYASTDETLIRSIIDIAEADRKEALDKISEEVSYVSTSQDSSSGYTYLNKYTKCGDKRCSLEDGKKYQENLILEKDYYTTDVVVKSNTDLLYEAARDLLFSENVEDYLYGIGDTKYLMSPAYLEKEDKRINDIILFDSASSKYYLVAVDIIDSQSSFADKVLVAEVLSDKISDSTIFNYCFEKLDVEIYDKEIREHFETKYGETEVE